MSDLVLDDWLSMCEHWRALALKCYEPLSESKCNELVQESLQAIKNHKVPESTKQTGNDPSGWRDSIHLDDDGRFVRFTTRKTLLNVDMKQLVDHTWTLYSDGDAFKKAHLGDNCDFYLQVLQTLSPDMMIVQRVEQHPGIAQPTHSLGISFRVQTETGYLVAFRCIESPQLQSVMKAEGLSLCGSFTWDTFDVEHRDGECDAILLTVAGSIGSDDPTYAKQARDGLMNALMLYETKLEDTPVLSV